MINDADNLYRLFVPAQAVGANLIYFDLWNATGSGREVRVWSVIPIVSGAVAVTGLLAVDLFVNRTTAIGTGGTAATRGGSSFTAMTIVNMSGKGGGGNESITARLTPSGGATAGAVISWDSVFTEETQDGTYMASLKDLIRRGYTDMPSLRIPENTGMSVVQGSVASVGNIGFDVIFSDRVIV